MLQIRLPWNAFLLRTHLTQLAQPHGTHNQLHPAFLHFFALLCGWSDEVPSNKGEKRAADAWLLDQLREILNHNLAPALMLALENTIAPTATVSEATIQHVLQLLITVSKHQLSRGARNCSCTTLIRSRWLSDVCPVSLHVFSSMMLHC